MNEEFDYDLTPSQWEALRALRTPASKLPRISLATVDGLIALGLAAMNGEALTLGVCAPAGCQTDADCASGTLCVAVLGPDRIWTGCEADSLVVDQFQCQSKRDECSGPDDCDVAHTGEAGAGPASGIFAIANKYVEIASIYPREERALATFTLGPNQTRMISIQTVPLGGSAYPAALIIR